ncbi:ergothioneine biosynthesis protein EgtB [Pseudotenacibaculum sp. MALMAid0570]|uniref:ergothioneine biosynthesis protein EgtB n=1 Tax=Pseudotenacibaculum sp. MALMAid0570 TaxID=3143938 RepID=UPI0032E0146C
MSIRKHTEDICAELNNEDYSVQPEIFVSPIKWHLAHSTWFFEQFVLTDFASDYSVYDLDFAFLFNSYYNNVGKRVLRPNRGLMTRPSVQKVYEYRAFVNEKMETFLSNDLSKEVVNIIEIGLQHEQQHQELMHYDIKYILGNQATFPTLKNSFNFNQENTALNFLTFNEGVYEIGHQGDGFCFDNELGKHKVYVHQFEISDRLVTNKEYLEFINAGGYQDFNLWHAEGWDFIQENNLKAPLYWHQVDGEWHHYNLHAFEKINPNELVKHLSFYEASAFAAWKGMRLPTEFEWEIAADQMNWGKLWEWTNSAYLPYPNFQKAEGALGEYNGKFMVNQMVLRGASLATSPNHSRKTYRNFFHPDMRWLYSGIRLVKHG